MMDYTNSLSLFLNKDYYCLISVEDFDKVTKFKWFLNKGKTCWYARRTKKPYIFLHKYLIPCGKPLVVDHINGNPLDNRRDNLQVCSQSYNVRKGIKRPNTSSKYKGVCYCKRDRNWCASIKIKNKSIHIGKYKTELEAGNAYNEYLEKNKELFLS